MPPKPDKTPRAAAPRDVTLKDIALEANVSVWLVSSVLNRRHEERRIAPASVEKVLGVAAQMGYLPNVAARQLRKNTEGGRSLVLAVMTNKQMPFSLTEHLMRCLHSNDFPEQRKPFTVEVKLYEGGQLSHLHGVQAADRFNAAVISNTTPEDDAFLESHKLPYPAIIVNRHIPGYSCVVDSSDIGAGAAKILADTDSRFPVVLAPKLSTQSVALRSESFVRAAETLGQTPTVVACKGFAVKDGFEAMRDYLKRGGKLDSLYCLTDSLCMGACHALKLAGLRVPRDVCVLGIGDSDIGPYFDPPLSTFGGSINEVGNAIAEVIGEQLSGHPPAPRIIEIHARKQLRLSTARGALART